MRLKHLILTFLTGVILCACSKEDSVDTSVPGAPGPVLHVPAGKLARMVYKGSGAENSITDFLYDDAGRWAGFNAPGGDPLIQGHTAARIVRNSNGIITAFTVKNSAGNPGESTYKVYYDEAQNQYLARSGTVIINGSPVVDSTVFDYANGRIVSGNIFIRPLSGSAATAYGKIEFSYDATGNITGIKTSLLDALTNTIEPSTELNMEFDNKPNAMPVGAEAIVLDYIYGASNNNIRKVSSLDLANGTDTVVNLYADYTYRGDNKPQTAEIHADGATLQISYVYK